MAAEKFQLVLSRSVEGDTGAFAEIVREYQSMVFGLACHILRDRAEAEELAQEVFLHLFRNLHAIRSPEHLVFWLRKVTSHRCIDAIRRHKLRPQVSLDDVPDLPARHEEDDPLLRGTLRKLVASLPEKQRLVLILRFQEDLDPGEISKVLNMPVNTVKSHLQRSLALLREKMVSMQERGKYE